MISALTTDPRTTNYTLVIKEKPVISRASMLELSDRTKDNKIDSTRRSIAIMTTENKRYLIFITGLKENVEHFIVGWLTGGDGDKKNTGDEREITITNPITINNNLTNLTVWCYKEEPFRECCREPWNIAAVALVAPVAVAPKV